MARDDHQLKFRVPAGLKAALEKSASENHRSLNAEITARLEESMVSGPNTQKNLEATADLFRMLAKNMRAFRLVMEAERAKPPADPDDIPKSSWDEILEVFDTMADPERDCPPPLPLRETGERS